jgi:hypothetical protein
MICEVHGAKQASIFLLTILNEQVNIRLLHRDVSDYVIED